MTKNKSRIIFGSILSMFLLLFLFQWGSYLSIEIFKNEIKQQAFTQKSITEQWLSVEDSKKIIQSKESIDEITINGQYFDIESFKIIGNRVLVKGVVDAWETEFISALNHQFHHSFSGKIFFLFYYMENMESYQVPTHGLALSSKPTTGYLTSILFRSLPCEQAPPDVKA